MTWDDDDLFNGLVKCRRRGLSYGQTAKSLGLTRGQVAGAVHRYFRVPRDRPERVHKDFKMIDRWDERVLTEPYATRKWRSQKMKTPEA